MGFEAVGGGPFCPQNSLLSRPRALWKATEELGDANFWNYANFCLSFSIPFNQ